MKKEMTNFKEELNAIMEKYGYTIVAYCLDERIGRSSHKRATLELSLEPIEEDPEQFECPSNEGHSFFII